MLTFVEQRVRDGAYADTADYLRDLVRRDREQQAAQSLSVLIEEGLTSGTATPLTQSEVERVRERVTAAGR